MKKRGARGPRLAEGKTHIINYQHDKIMIERLIEDSKRKKFTLGEAWAARSRAQSVLLNNKLFQYHNVAKQVLEKREIKEILNI